MKKLISLLLALCMLFALAACGAADDAADDAAADDAAADDAAADAGDATADAVDAAAADAAASGFDWAAYEGCEVEIMWQESDSTQIDIVENFAKPALQAIADEYGITITWVSTLDASIPQLAATGSLSDIFFGTVTKELRDSGIILDITPYLEADTYLADTFNSPNFFYFNDVIWCLSTGVDNFYNGVFYYNKDIFAANGIDEADMLTYEGFIGICDTLLAAGIQPLTWEGQGAGTVGRFLWQNAVIAQDVNAYQAILSGEADAMNSDAIITVYDNYRSWMDAGYLGEGLFTRTTSDAISDFGFGDAAILWCDSWNNGGIFDAVAGEFEVGQAWFPETNEYIAGWGSPLSGWAVNAEAENPELVVEILKALVKAEAARHLNAGLGTNHVQEGTPEAPNYLEEDRFALRDGVGEFLKGFWQNSMDNAMTTEMTAVLDTLSSEDAVTGADLAARAQTAWEANTFFD